MLGWEWKSGGIETVSLYKFTQTPLLKNDGQLKHKSDKQPKKKKQSPNLLKNKNHVWLNQKKNIQNKTTITPITQKRKKKKKGNV